MVKSENESYDSWESGNGREDEKEKRRKNWRRKMEEREFDDWESEDWEKEYRKRGRFFDEDDYEEDSPEFIEKDDDWADDDI